MTDAPTDAPRERAPGNQWQKPLLWTLIGLAALLMIASFTGNGTGMFGWGFMMGMMWIWMLVPILLVVLLVVLVMRLQEPRR